MRLRLSALFLLTIVLLTPLSAFAQGQGSMFDPIIPEECKCRQVQVIAADGTGTDRTSPSAPNWGCVLKVLQNVINTVIGIAVLIVVLSIVYGAFIFMTRGGNPGAREQARNVIGSSLVGLFIILSAWLIVDFVMKMVYDQDAVAAGNIRLGPWNAVWAPSGNDMCITVREPVPIATGTLTIATTPPGPIGGTYGGGAGRCSVPTGGPCSVANLQRYFGSAASQASIICNAESRGVINRASDTDRMRNDPQRRAFSFGLFQINITVHSVAGLDCPSAFNGRNYSATVRNENLYRQCAAAAQTERHNIAEAIATYNRTRWREWSTARPCGLASLTNEELAYGGKCLMERLDLLI